MNINLLKLQIVELIDKHGKITAVAEVLGLTQPTVTFHMKGMEQELGVRLFENRRGRICLTEAGRSLCHYAVKINALAGEAERVVQEHAGLERGALRIGASYVPATYVLPGVLSTFAALYPKVSVSLEVKPAPAIEALLVSHELDFGLFSAEESQARPLPAEKLCQDELVLIHAPQHPLAGQPEISPGELAAYPFIVHARESTTRRLTDKWVAANRIGLQAALETDSLEAIKRTVMMGRHISFVSRLAVSKETEQGTLSCRPIPGDLSRRAIYEVRNADRQPSMLLDSFIQHLREEVGASGLVGELPTSH